MVRTIAKDHDAKRLKILKNAASVFAREGIARASMNGLARETGISKANIYHYYASKDALLFDILDSYLSALRDVVLGADLADAPPPERLEAMISEILLAYAGMDHEHKIQAEGIALLPADQQDILRSYQREIVAKLSAILHDHAPAVFGDDKVKLRAATMSVFGMLNWFYMWNNRADDAARKEYARVVTRLVLGGVKAL